MWFIDEARITVKGGDGGRGCASYAQPPYIRYPYPDGGDGGHGGDVILRADSNIATLLDFQFRHEFAAGRGGHGGSNQKSGKRGDDLVIRVPVGTVVQDAVSGDVLRDLAHPDAQTLIAEGGHGGKGNATVAAAVRAAFQHGSKRRRGTTKNVQTTDQEATPGGRGEERQIRLELKLIADVGLIGLPNAGKSSLLSRISTAHPKIAAYPFTTKFPVLGVATVDEREPFVACDIPGLIEGAHEGKGLGIQFLRHIERTRLLVHVIDMAAVDGKDPLAAFEQVNHELEAYSESLMQKPQMVVANKMDLAEARENLRRVERSLPQPVWRISAATGQGIPELMRGIRDALNTLPYEGP